MENKVLIVVGTYNNQALLSNFISSFERLDPGFSYDLLIADNTSTDNKHLNYLSKIAAKYKIESYENDRIEATYDAVSQKYINNYKYFLFLHDDTVVVREDWLHYYIERLNSGYFEPSIKQTHYAGYPIGRVSACSQYWRDYDTCMGYPLPSRFLQKALKVLGKNTLIFKYSDIDRTLYTQECLQKCGIWSVNKFKAMEGSELYTKLITSLNEDLRYPDEGIPPKNKYPAGNNWNKLTLLSEFLNSIMPLMEGYRTVGLQGEGYLEQIHGDDSMMTNTFLVHFGAHHTKKWLAKQFKTTPEVIHKRIYDNDLPFLMKCNMLFKDYLQNG